MQVERYPDLQRLHTPTMDRSRLDFPSAAGPRRKSPNQPTTCDLQVRETGLDRSQEITQAKVSLCFGMDLGCK